jgi:hypothetical protein
MCGWAIGLTLGAVKTRFLNPLCVLAAVVAALALAGPAAASVTVEGTGEPAFTNSAGNTQWFRTQIPTGTDAYRVRYRWYVNGAQVQEQTVPAGEGGVTWASWSGVATLVHGGTYTICAQGEMSLPNDDLYFADGSNSCASGDMEGKRSSTTIDRSKPTASIVAAGGAETVKTGQVPVSIAFQDDVAGPHPANFMCVGAGTDPCSMYAWSASCSVPAAPGKSTTFDCAVDASQLEDGPVTVCVRAADAALPDDPSSANQTGSATQSNLSDPQCDTVTLDRSVPPPVTKPDPKPTHPTNPSPPSNPSQPASPVVAPGLKGIQVGGVAIQLPKRIKLGKVRQLVFGTRAAQAGRLTLRLTRGKKVYARLTVGLSPGETKQRLRLPKRLKAGTYTVKIAFRASGMSWSATGSARIACRK